MNRSESQGTFTPLRAQGLGRAEARICSGRAVSSSAEDLMEGEVGVGMTIMGREIATGWWWC